ncbi:MAG TPA: winged helix-turn-helix domain-containing protein [Solirubrobacteraceae bacterium]|nr:winged helix-turn-helix domain-containing protein [Solirubrobacteraceae bacterium]
MSTTATRPSWLFLSNHGYVLLCVARDPSIRIRELADRVGIGERAAQKIIADLVADGYITRTRDGRRNRYTINRGAQLRHPLLADLPIGPLVDALIAGDESIDGHKPSSAR